MTHLLQIFKYYCLFQCPTLSQVLEFASTDCIYLPLILPVRVKNGIALLPCIYELTVMASKCIILLLCLYPHYNKVSIITWSISMDYKDYLSRIVRKPDFAYAKTKAQISFAVTAKLISAFVFATRIVQFLFFLNPKLQASSPLL